jgi:hypothetical protein
MTPQEQANDLFNRALGHFHQQRFYEANALMEPLLSLAPNSPPALNLKAVLVRELGNAKSALPYAVQAVTLSPQDPFYCCNLGQILADLNHHEEAISAFEIGFKFFLARTGHHLSAKTVLLDLAHIAIGAPHALTESSVYLERYMQLLHFRPQASSLRLKLIEDLKNKDFVDNSPDEATAQDTLRLLLDIIGLFFNTPAADNQAAVETLALPWLRQSLERDWFDLALWLERELDLRYVHQIKTEEHHRRHYQTVAPLMNQAGRRLRADLPALPSPSTVNASNLAFLTHVLHPYDANRVILDTLRGMGVDAKNATVFVLDDVEPSAYQDFVATGARVVALSLENPHLKGKWYQLLLELRRRLADENIGVVLWATNNAHMSFAFGLRLAPTQIWWSMQFHDIELEDIDVYLAHDTLRKFKQYGNRIWRCTHGAFSNLYNPGLRGQAKEIRQSFPVETLLGCMGRVEKVNNIQYLNAVTNILLARPDTGFLWSGQSQLPSVQEHFKKAGVAERCFFIGWVNTALYAQVLDICLDTFPIGGGITAFECMAATKAVVFYLSPEALEAGVPMSILPLLNNEIGTPKQQEMAKAILTGKNGENLFLCARNSQEHTDMALHLIDDDSFRKDVGRAMKKFTDTFMEDKEEMARTLLAHIREILSERKSCCAPR